MIMIMSLVYQI